jgi:predicted Rossmann-fold nucleotide-binding protein
VPIILIGTEFWKPLTSWLDNTLLAQEHMIAPADLALWMLTDDLELVVSTIEKRIDQQMKERLATTGHANRTPDERLHQATQPMHELEQ